MHNIYKFYIYIYFQKSTIDKLFTHDILGRKVGAHWQNGAN